MSLFFAMVSFSLAMSISPGPVNLVIVSSGANYGIRRTFPFVTGATVGFTLLLMLIGLGYLIASAEPTLTVKKQQRPTFIQGFLLQWLNPKAWLACVAGASLFASTDSYHQFLVFCCIYFISCYLSLFLWSVLGDKVSFILTSRRRFKLFNLLMGLLLIATACFLLWVDIN